jgi:hypothetical protein
MDRLKAIEELAEKWVKENSLTAFVNVAPIGEIKAFVAGFLMSMDLSKDAWDSGYQAGKAYGEAMAEGKKA